MVEYFPYIELLDLMLSKSEIKSLVRCLGDASRFITALRERDHIAKYVQYPKIPPALSESLAVHALRDRTLLKHQGPFSAVELGGRVADYNTPQKLDRAIRCMLGCRNR